MLRVTITSICAAATMREQRRVHGQRRGSARLSMRGLISETSRTTSAMTQARPNSRLATRRRQADARRLVPGGGHGCRGARAGRRLRGGSPACPAEPLHVGRGADDALLVGIGPGRSGR